MVNIREVKTCRDKREFVNFPLRLYKDCPYFVPPLYADEKKLLNKSSIYEDTCESVYYLAERDGKTVGRISGIIQKTYNEKHGEKRVRFTRFDSIDDNEVAAALFGAVEGWAKEKGMDTACGPLGFSDLEREGLLIEGFDQLSTFEEQYNYDYYPKLIENLGYVKEVDWVERKLYKPDTPDEKFIRVSGMMLKKYGLHFAECKNMNEFIERYAEKFFDLLDLTYENLYGTVPFNKSMRKSMISSFKSIVDLKHVTVVVDENDNLACLGICFPSIAKAVQKSGGKLTPAAIVRLLKAIKNPKVIDLGLIGVHPDYAKKGVSNAVTAEIMKMLLSGEIEYAETNLNLEDNYNIQNQWKRFNSVIHKRRRSYVKKLN